MGLSQVRSGFCSQLFSQHLNLPSITGHRFRESHGDNAVSTSTSSLAVGDNNKAARIMMATLETFNLLNIVPGVLTGRLELLEL